MNDQWVAVVVGAATVVTLRVLDFFLPKGWVSEWTRTHARQAEKDAAEDAETDVERRDEDKQTRARRRGRGVGGPPG